MKGLMPSDLVCKVHQSEEQVRKLFDLSLDLLCVASFDGRFTLLNPAWQKKFGYSLEELYERKFLDFIHPDDLETTREEILKLKNDNGHQTIGFENRYKCKDGSYVYLHWNATSSPEHKLIFATARDLTEEIKSKKLLIESEKRFRTLSDKAPVMIWEVDKDKMCTYLNNRWMEYTGLSLEKSLNLGWFKAVHPDDRAAYLRAVSISFDKREEFRLEYRIRNAKGDYRWFMNTGAPKFLADGEFIGYIGTLVDIHDIITVEEKLKEKSREIVRSNKELEQFAYVASHDLQEPLRKVLAFGDRLMIKFGDSLGDQGNDYIRRMHNAASRMQTLLNDLLQYSRITTKAGDIQTINLANLIDDILVDLEERINEIEPEIEIGDLPYVEAEPTQMRQLFQNLISNAIKFRKDDHRPLIKIFSEESEEGSHLIHIEDNGIGFDNCYNERIFEQFQRLNGKDDFEGTGMGLAICRKIALRHEGDIFAEAEYGKGSKFTIKLPKFTDR